LAQHLIELLGLNLGLAVLSNVKNKLTVFFLKLPYLLYLIIILILVCFIFSYFLKDKPNVIVFDRFFFNSLKFTFIQAILSTLISIIIGFLIGICLYLSRIKIKLISVVLNFFFIAPVIFVSYGVIFIHGSNGLIQSFLNKVGINFSYSIFGFVGILYVTSYFNISLSANYFFRKLINIPENYLKLLQANNVSFYQALKYYLRPIFQNNIIVLCSIVLIFCISNFTIIYIFANSPFLSTLELVIYQKISFEANIYAAIVYGLIQAFIVILLLSPLLKISNNFQMLSLKKTENYKIYKSNLLSTSFLIIMSIYFFSPCLMIFKGLSSFNLDLLISYNAIKSFLSSLSVATISLLLSLLISLSSLYFARKLFEDNSRFKKLMLFSIFILCFVPAISLSSIIFMINIKLDFYFNNFWIVSIINSCLLIPIIFLFLLPKFMDNNIYEKSKILQFGINPLIRIFKIDLIKFKKDLILISSACFVLSMGDLTSVTIFNSSEFKTVPFFISQLYSSYRYDDAFFIMSIYVIFIISLLYIVSLMVHRDATLR